MGSLAVGAAPAPYVGSTLTTFQLRCLERESDYQCE